MDANQTIEMIQAFLSQRQQQQQQQTQRQHQQQQQNQFQELLRQSQQHDHDGRLSFQNLVTHNQQQQQDQYMNALASATYLSSTPNSLVPAPLIPNNAMLQQQQSYVSQQQQEPSGTDRSISNIVPLSNSVSGYPSQSSDSNNSNPGARLLQQRRHSRAGSLASVASSSRRRELTEKEKFVLFVKILLKCLDQSSNPRLKPLAKATISECTRRNRLGDSSYTPLQEAVERRLRKTVGEDYWTRAKLLCDQYCQRREMLITAV